ncbi:hypothetical protein C8Q77DRAFT_1216962 [Trametes polyzona]|nr:hypothetical protein C8Q77DRAFT_1216962 [Trametes polyzona]
MALLSLPDELLVQVASQLEFRDLVSLNRVCNRWRDVVESHAALQYAIELRVAGMVDNPESRMVLGERLRILRAKEKAWRELDLSDKKALTLSHRPSGIYDLTGGTLLLGERRNSEIYTGTDAVYTISLHSAFNEARNNASLWSNIDLGKQIIDVGLAIHEHDLIAIVTYSYVNEAQLLASVDIHLLKHSTGQPHPAAAKPVIHYDNIHYLPGHCSIMLEISGDSLCFLLNNYFPFINADPVTFVIYNWKTGLPIAGQCRMYSDPTMFNSFVMLSSDTVMLPIIPGNHLEICQFTEELNMPPRPQPAQKSITDQDVPFLKTKCILQLPPIYTGALVLRMTCRCEPNPRGPPSSATHVNKDLPFFSDPERAIMVLHMHLRLPTGSTRVFTMIVHRASLLKVMNDAFERERKVEEMRRASLSDYLNLDEAHSDSSDEEAARSPRSSSGTPEPPTISSVRPVGQRRNRAFSWYDEGDAPAADDGILKLPWAEWGPAVTRWFQDELPGTRWITTTCGQRFVRLRPDGPAGSQRLHVYDFDELAIRRYAHERAMRGEPIGARAGERMVEREQSERREPEDPPAAFMFTDEEHDEEMDEPVNEGVHEAAGEEADDEMDDDEEDENDEAPGPSLNPDDPGRVIKLVLGETRIEDNGDWQDELVSALPYMETSVNVPDEYESVLLDEDILIGLKMDREGRHIKEVVLHRIGGPVA